MIQPPDPRARRNAVMVVLGIAVFGTAAVIATDRFAANLEDLARADPDLAAERASLVIRLLVLGLTAVLAGFAAWLLHFSLRIRNAERFPPPGTRLIRDSRVLTGEEARARARLGFTMAGIIAAAAIGVYACLWRAMTILTAP